MLVYRGLARFRVEFFGSKGSLAHSLPLPSLHISLDLSISRSLALLLSLHPSSLSLSLSHAREFRTLKSRAMSTHMVQWMISFGSKETGRGGEASPSLGNTWRDKLPHPCDVLVSALTCFSSVRVASVSAVMSVYEV